MIFNTDLNAKRNANYEYTIKNLEKAKELLNDRFAKKQISNEDYIRKAKEIDEQIKKYKQVIGQDY
jgi:uncharacterized membrane protein